MPIPPKAGGHDTHARPLDPYLGGTGHDSLRASVESTEARTEFGRESSALRAAAELILFAAAAGTRCVAIGAGIPFARRRLSRVGPRGRRTRRQSTETPLVHPGEHLLVSPDHRDDDGPPKFGEFRVLHPEGLPHFGEHRLPLV